MEIYREVVERRMRELGLNSEKLSEKLQFKSVHGLNKILREGSTKEKTVKLLAEVLGVHASMISPEIPAPGPAFRQGSGTEAMESLLAHERAITKLRSHIIQLYRLLGKELTQTEVDDLYR